MYLKTEKGHYPVPESYNGPDNDELDRLFTMTELWTATDERNKRSAPGRDVITYKLLGNMSGAAARGLLEHINEASKSSQNIVKMPNSTFTAIDYAVLIGSLMVPVSIGTYYAWLDRKRTTNREFLIASRQMGWFPVSLSMVASFLSATSMLGLPSEVFVRGSVLWIGSICACIAIVVAAFVFLPVYYNMDLTSINEVSMST
ncbi:hypothetical protein HPB52_002906 [Rhipicephalus sanguineus]|uniref:Uncharacterized protein n=1 Tax=Rhipicephalus sanguineus TaxID=34632 RepID=A0A9D4Q4I5_RHISA|nr:hypothetical protein HPB52_002906 [Rhipicephalus sanguineus]